MAPQVEITNWASIWSVAVAVNEMCVKNGKSGNARPQSKCNFLRKPSSLPTRYHLAFLKCQPLVTVDGFHSNSQWILDKQQAPIKTASYFFSGVHGNMVLFLFGRGSDPPPEILSSLNMSSSDLSMLSIFNTTPHVISSLKSY